MRIRESNRNVRIEWGFFQGDACHVQLQTSFKMLAPDLAYAEASLVLFNMTLADLADLVREASPSAGIEHLPPGYVDRFKEEVTP